MASVDSEVISSQLPLRIDSLNVLSQEQSATISLSVPTGLFTTDDKVISVGFGELENVEAEHHVSDSLRNVTLAASAKKLTIPGLVPQYWSLRMHPLWLTTRKLSPFPGIFIKRHLESQRL